MAQPEGLLESYLAETNGNSDNNNHSNIYSLQTHRLQLETSANYTVDDSFEVDTRDHEDHSFCGIIFDVEVKNEGLPIYYLGIDRIWVRGMLGNMTVWYKKVVGEDANNVRFFQREDDWTNIFERFKEPSPFSLTSLELENPLVLKPGVRYSLYIHSSRNDDLGIVYDDQRNHITYEDDFVNVYPGTAHISPIAFDNHGWWGWAWRPHREFVGRISYGVRYLCWKPEKSIHMQFPKSFQQGVVTLLLCSKRGPFSSIPEDIVLYIINMCSWDWFGESKQIVDKPTIIPLVSNHGIYREFFSYQTFRKMGNWRSFRYGMASLILLIAVLLKRFLKL
mmetsp:Transcript_10585/g.12075  ORF Transcript_10585/g.12075 Transcript_10585/m.12075 type:complete len:335 (-) Transcript_10585:682-1686(-)